MGGESLAEGGAGGQGTGHSETCDNLIDDDDNGLLDCQEADCKDTEYCSRQQATVVQFDEKSRLVYGPNGQGEQLVDFSFAGYEGGGVAIPEVAEALVVDPSAGDDTSAIQSAIDQVSALKMNGSGFRGAIRLAPGLFRISAPLLIVADGVVLRGSGASKTIIIHEGTDTEASILLSGEYEFGDTVTPITDMALPLGARQIHVEDPSAFEAGDEVFIRGIRELPFLEAIGMEEEWSSILGNPGGFTVRLSNFIDAVDKETGLVTLRAGLTDRLSPGIGHHSSLTLARVDEDRRLRHVGVEDLTLISEYDPSVLEPKGSMQPIDMNHAAVAVDMLYVVDSWVQRVVSYFYGVSGVRVNGWTSSRITLQDLAVLDMVERDTPTQHKGGTKYAINTSGNGTLVQRTFVRNTRHGFIMNGPRERNVFLDCVSVLGHIASEPHQTWTTSSLYDNVYSDSMFKLNRVEHSDHGQRAIHSVMYNLVSESARSTEPDFWLDDPPGGVGRNYGLGLETRGTGRGVKSPSLELPVGSTADDHLGRASLVEGIGTSLRPRSLYLAQLWDRLGNDGILNVTTETQRISREAMWSEMRQVYDTIPIYQKADDLSFLPDRYPFD